MSVIVIAEKAKAQLQLALSYCILEHALPQNQSIPNDDQTDDCALPKCSVNF